ncbi:MAG TPA: GTPase [Stellaceae bacterium]|nr:GTPase [Stellaceae bacterium]
MRLKTFTAASLAEAMTMVRDAFGDDAIIVSTEESEFGFKIVTAVEEPFEDEFNGFGTFGADHYATDPAADPVEIIHESLLNQGLPSTLMERLIEASFTAGSDQPIEALTGALRLVFQFRPLQEDYRPGQALMLVGMPGSGKTVTVAKLAARAVFANHKVRLITADTVRAGAVEQLDAFARLMKVPLHTVETGRELGEILGRADPDELVLVDSPGTNPYSVNEMAELAGLVRGQPIETVLVQAAGMDSAQAIDQARSFSALGCSRLLVTQLDMTRRYGAMLAGADAARLPFCDFSNTAAIHEGLTFIDPGRMASMLLPQFAAAQAAPSAPDPTTQSAFQGYRS